MACNSIWSLSLDELKRMAAERLSLRGQCSERGVTASPPAADQDQPERSANPRQEIGPQSGAWGSPSS